MTLKQLSYCIAALLLLSSCSQLKSLSARDNSANAPRTVSKKKSTSKDPKFLDISVSPGQVVTTKHNTELSMPDATKRKREREVYNNMLLRRPSNSADIEMVDWLQLKYAIALDATVETLTNLNLLKTIDDWLGTDYCSGGSTKNCIDCSGFSHALMQEVYNLNLPRTAQEQFNNSQKINMEELNEGDLVFFHTGGREISHVGVYLQNNKFVHAASSGGVMVSDLNDSYWKPRFKGAGRYNSVPATSANANGSR